MRNYQEFFTLKGQTLIDIKGLSEDTEEVTFVTDQNKYNLVHIQDCCENVRLIKYFGVPTAILNSKIIVAEEDGGACDPPWYKERYYESHTYVSHTWSHYRIVTENGNSLDLWFLGESNGYYGEGMSFIAV